MNVDIDVPLFLPIYGQRRLYDLRRIARTEQLMGHRIHGQMVFDSGWEWGYWLNAVVAARAAWDPLLRIDDDWEAYAESLKPITRLLPAQYESELQDIMVNLAKKQSDLLINGIVGGKPSPDINKLAGMPYLSGSDTWVDVPRLFNVALTQPDKVRMFETDDSSWVHVAPLLNEMESAFTRESRRMNDLRENMYFIISNETCGGKQESCSGTYWGALQVLEELADSLNLLTLRTRQVRLLYEGCSPESSYDRKALLFSESRKSIIEAQGIVKRREAAYPAPVERVGAWRENPTVYRFTYLWAVHSLYYWWRDQGLAERGSVQSHYSPCYLNRMDASEVAVGWGKYTLELLRSLIHYYWPDSSRNPVELINCIAAPSREYSFPRDMYLY